jgi:cbb3-type cytochrome oxidase maturation protein
MSAIIFLIIIGVIVAGGFLAAFIWAVRSGQYDDDYSPSVRILFDNKTDEEDEKETDEQLTEKEKSQKKENNNS